MSSHRKARVFASNSSVASSSGCWSDSDMVKLQIMSHAFGRTPRQRVDTIIRSAVALFKTSERNALILTFARSPRRLDAPIILSAAVPCLHHSSC
jgi:hypothetical protein